VLFNNEISLQGRLLVMDPRKINTGYHALLQACKNTVAPEERVKLRKALDLAIKACCDNIIMTGEPEILHALSVARIIAGEMGLGLTSIITALLHDSYNNLYLTPKELEKEFGKKVVEILNGFSRIQESIQCRPLIRRRISASFFSAWLMMSE